MQRKLKRTLALLLTAVLLSGVMPATGFKGGWQLIVANALSDKNETIILSNTSESDWVLESDVPAGAQITASKWVYTLKTYTISSSSTLAGYTRDDSRTTYITTWSDILWYDNQQPTHETFRYVGTRSVEAYSITYLYRYYSPSKNLFSTAKLDSTYVVDGYWVNTSSVYKYDKFHSGQDLYMSNEITAVANDYPCWKGETKTYYKTLYGYQSGTRVYTYSFYSTQSLESFTDPSGTGDKDHVIENVIKYVRYVIQEIDRNKPVGTISASNDVSTSQTITLKMSDNKGIAGYYWGTSSSYASNTYTAASSTSANKTVSAAGTYYLTVKDTSDNLSDTVSITFFTTTLNANGGSVSPASVLTQSGKAFPLPTPTRSGYTFASWNTASSGSGTVYTGSYTVNSSKTLYALWQIPNIYNLGEETYSFKNYGDSDSPNGHCFGMAATSSGYYLGILSKSIIGGNDQMPLYSFRDTATVRKPICHYLQIQGTAANSAERKAMVAGGSIDLHGTINTRADWNACVNYVKNHAHDHKGTLNIGTWYNEGGGHAVNFLYYKEENGQQRIYIYDNNNPSSESYYYMGDDNYIHEGPSTGWYPHIVGMDLMDVEKYFPLANQYEPYRYIFAGKDEIIVEGATMCDMKCDPHFGTTVMFEIPKDAQEVTITPLVENAEFQYFENSYSFGAVDAETYGTLKVASKNAQPGTPMTFNIYNEPKCEIRIKNFVNNCTVDYRTTITFSAEDVKNPVSGASIHWFINGQDKGASDTYTEKEAKANFTVQAKYMKNGQALAESEVETVKVNTGFFAKLKAFFRALFGRLPKVVQAYLGVEFSERPQP